MKQREIQDEHRRWTCAQAFAAVDGEAADQAEQGAGNGLLTVVCTPSGGAGTVRLQLPAGWDTDLSDDELKAAIRGATA